MKRAFVSILLAGAVAAAFGTAGAARAQGATAIETTTVSSYVNGGVGKDEQRAMRSIARDFPLRIEFSEHKDHELIAGVPVAITDGQGNPVLELRDAGPMLFVKLPDGSYRVSATRNGKTEKQSVTLKGNQGRDLYFHWR